MKDVIAQILQPGMHVYNGDFEKRRLATSYILLGYIFHVVAYTSFRTITRMLVQQLLYLRWTDGL